MKVAAVVTTFNEVDIIAATVLHLRRHGIDRVYAADASTDGTYELLKALDVDVERDTEPCHRQPYWTGRLAERATDAGADWVLPFDADEFFTPEHGTIVEALAEVPDDVGKVMAPMLHYHDFFWRCPHPKPFPKAVVRARLGVEFANGNHDATVAGAELRGVLTVREVQYRGFRHFCRKIRERCQTLDPSLPSGEGTHHTKYAGWSEIELEPVWKDLAARATTYDPIR